jgi:hypothetical protein
MTTVISIFNFIEFVENLFKRKRVVKKKPYVYGGVYGIGEDIL